MKILIDHCIDWRLARAFPNHEVKTAQQMGWEDLKNGKLLAEAERAFEVMITTDQNLKSQQNLKYLPVAVIVLLGRSNKIEDLQPLAPLCELVMKTVKRGQLFEVRLPDQIVEVTA